MDSLGWNMVRIVAIRLRPVRFRLELDCVGVVQSCRKRVLVSVVRWSCHGDDEHRM